MALDALHVYSFSAFWFALLTFSSSYTSGAMHRPCLINVSFLRTYSNNGITNDTNGNYLENYFKVPALN